MRFFGRTPADDAEAVERDLDLAWELLAAQPTHPKVGELARRVLASQPERSSATLLLANHREICGETDEARRLYLEVIGRGDSQRINAARALRHLAAAEHDYPAALQWASTVLGESQEDWDDWMELGSALALCGELDKGWRHLDEAVELCARTAPDELAKALGMRAVYLLGTFAPPDQFIPAAEEAIRADAANSWVSLMLGWSYLVQYRFADAEQLALRLLREDPTEEQFQSLRGTAQTMQGIVENAGTEGYTLDDVKRTGVLEMTWQQLRDRELGLDLKSALAALEDAMPADVRATLRPGATFTDETDMPGAMAADDLVTWRDGQHPDTGATWLQPEPFRLMSSAEINAMNETIEADPAAYPQWPENDAWEPVMTDDAGSYLVVVAFGALIKRRSGQPDEPVAASMADWIWDRVADFGGRDPRPAPRRDAVADIEQLNADCLAAPGEIEPEIRLWQAVTALHRWFFIDRGTPEQPHSYAIAAESGAALCLYSSAERAKAAAHAIGLVPQDEPVAVTAVPLPEALDWVMAFGEHGVTGVVLDYPELGAWCPLPNLAKLRDMRP